RGGSVTARDLQRANNRKYPSASFAEIALDQLAEAGLGVWEEVPTTAQGGHPTRRLVLCTTHDTNDTTPPQAGKPPEGVSDTTADGTPQTGENPSVSGGSVGCVMRRAETEGDSTRRSGSASGEVVSGGCVGHPVWPDKPVAGGNSWEDS